jgi:hypothetical protein
MLNLCYALAAVEVRLACLAVGLDPALGFVHADMARRDGLVFDVLEPVRVVVNQLLHDMVAERTFERADFVERTNGSIRVAPRLVQECAAAMPLFARTAAPHAEAIAHLLGRAVVGKWQPTTKLRPQSPPRAGSGEGAKDRARPRPAQLSIGAGRRATRSGRSFVVVRIVPATRWTARPFPTPVLRAVPGHDPQPRTGDTPSARTVDRDAARRP